MNPFEQPPLTPLAWLQSWLDDALELPLNEPMAMNLASLDEHGELSSRIVLFKGFKDEDICFFTNYNSRKGSQLQHHSQAALCFWWDALMRQVRIEGSCEKLPAADSDAYFASRPRGSQLGAWASQQSQPVENRNALEKAYAEQQRRFADGDVSRPPHWGGYRFRISRIEFWQGRDNRFHDRVVFTRQSNTSWQHQRLQP